MKLIYEMSHTEVKVGDIVKFNGDFWSVIDMTPPKRCTGYGKVTINKMNSRRPHTRLVKCPQIGTVYVPDDFPIKQAPE